MRAFLWQAELLMRAPLSHAEDSLESGNRTPITGECNLFGIRWAVLMADIPQRIHPSQIVSPKSAKPSSRYIDRILALAQKTGYVQTYFGRRRYCPEYQNGISDRDAHEIEKTLWNHVCAGTSAEIVKWKTVRIWEELRRIGFRADQVRLSLNMFDESIWMVQDDLLSEIRAIVEEIWKRKETGFLQFNSEVKIGKNWKECE